MRTATVRKTRNRLPLQRRWTREEFDRAEALGLFRPGERLELIEGEIIVRDAEVNTPHAIAQRKCEKALARLFSGGYDVRGQLPLALGERDKPLPDIAVVIGSEDDYLEEHPTTAALVVEISDTTLSYDRTVKLRLYARAGIPEYWILDVNNRRMEVYRTPRLQGRLWRYENVVVHAEIEEISPLAAPDVALEIAALLPRRLHPETE